MLKFTVLLLLLVAATHARIKVIDEQPVEVHVMGEDKTLIPKEAEQRFTNLDKDGNGFISTSELLEEFDMTTTDSSEELMEVNVDVIDEMISKVDVDGDGQVSFEEFLHVDDNSEKETTPQVELMEEGCSSSQFGNCGDITSLSVSKNKVKGTFKRYTIPGTAITVVGGSFFAIEKDISGDFKFSAPADSRKGDLMVGIVGYSGGRFRDNAVPSGWSRVNPYVRGTRNADLNINVIYKAFASGDENKQWSLPKEDSSFSIIFTLRNCATIDPIVSSWKISRDSLGGGNGQAQSQRVSGNNFNGAALIGAFLYDDPHVVVTKNQGKILSSFYNYDDGMAVIVGPSKKGENDRIVVRGRKAEGGGSNDINIAFVVKPKA